MWRATLGARSKQIAVQTMREQFITFDREPGRYRCKKKSTDIVHFIRYIFRFIKINFDLKMPKSLQTKMELVYVKFVIKILLP